MVWHPGCLRCTLPHHGACQGAGASRLDRSALGRRALWGVGRSEAALGLSREGAKWALNGSEKISKNRECAEGAESLAADSRHAG
jgi:hypothetical protein